MRTPRHRLERASEVMCLQDTLTRTCTCTPLLPLPCLVLQEAQPLELASALLAWCISFLAGIMFPRGASPRRCRQALSRPRVGPGRRAHWLRHCLPRTRPWLRCLSLWSPLSPVSSVSPFVFLLPFLCVSAQLRPLWTWGGGSGPGAPGGGGFAGGSSSTSLSPAWG